MKSQTTFEIKIAFCGYVNSGKSTLVNALLQQKYSEVSMNRSTYGVNAFRIFSSKEKSTHDLEEFETMSSKSTEESEIAWSVVPENVQSASQTHLAIATKNAELRGTDKIEESTFDIEVAESICNMREDTQLVVVDLPGLTDVTNDDDLIVKYLNATWDTYDCVVVVLDVMESIDKQNDLLNLVRENLKEKKDVPVIFVCNKVDHPRNQDVVKKLDALESLVHSCFALSGTLFGYEYDGIFFFVVRTGLTSTFPCHRMYPRVFR
jgi:small GTP-binding protein